MTIIGSFKTDEIKIIRSLDGYYDDDTGLYIEGDREVIDNHTVNVQPMKTSEMMHLSEGQRDKGMIKIYSDKPLFTVQDTESTSRKPDIIEWQGCCYEVQIIDNWDTIISDANMMDLQHYKVIAAKVEKQSTDRESA